MTHGFTLDELSSELGVKKRTVRNWIAKAAIPHPCRTDPRPFARPITYPSDVLQRLREIQLGYEVWPNGPIDSILAWIDRGKDDE